MLKQEKKESWRREVGGDEREKAGGNLEDSCFDGRLFDGGEGGGGSVEMVRKKRPKCSKCGGELIPIDVTRGREKSRRQKFRVCLDCRTLFEVLLVEVKKPETKEATGGAVR